MYIGNDYQVVYSYFNVIFLLIMMIYFKFLFF